MIKLKELLNGIDFSNFSSDPDSDEAANILMYRCKQAGLKYTYGATKFVIIDNDLGVVYKLPFRYTDYGDQLYGGLNDGWNYCGLECEISEDATKDQCIGLAPTKFVGVFNDLPIYSQPIVQPYVDKYLYAPDDDYGETVDMLFRKSIENIDRWYWAEWPIAWGIQYIVAYGYQKYYQLCKFLYEHDINDITRYNVGYDVCGNPIIYDYSGYNMNDY